jgi:hypothetical protein
MPSASRSEEDMERTHSQHRAQDPSMEHHVGRPDEREGVT